MKKVMLTCDQAAQLIASGAALLVAGDENLLASLPKGRWIGGSIPYFMGDAGGVETRDLLHAVILPEEASVASVAYYDEAALPNLYVDGPDNGFTVLIIPAFSGAHQRFAKDVFDYEQAFVKPLIGWVSGVALSDLGSVTPKVFNGLEGSASSDRAVALHAALPAGKAAKIDILNVFTQGDGPEIRFAQTGFSAATAMIDGVETNLAAWFTEQAIDVKLPLVADYHGAMINVSVQAVDPAAGEVRFYAPVFDGVAYRIAAPVADYRAAFAAAVAHTKVEPLFACNCVLNYLYAELEGHKTGDVTGPMTFGEIAYSLLNQTMVYLTIEQV